MATTRLGLNGFSVRRTGSFAGKAAGGGTHPVGLITRLGLNGFMVRRAGDFTGKTPNEIIGPPVVAPPPFYGGGTGAVYDDYPEKKKRIKEQARIEKIMREDQEILDLIITFVTKGPQ